MNFFNEITYFKTVKLLLSMIGQWPYQKILQRFCFGGCTLFVILSPIKPVILSIHDAFRKLNSVIQLIPVLTIFLNCYVKFLSIIINNSKIKGLLNIIENDWTSGKFSAKEYQILHQYDEFGRNWTFYYTVIMYILPALYMLSAVAPQILDIIIPLNETRQTNGIFPIQYYGLDTRKYFYVFVTHCYLITFVVMTVKIATDTMCYTCVQHACARFQILGNRLNNIFQEIDDVETSENENCYFSMNDRNVKQYVNNSKINDNRKIILCVEEHQKIISFAELINSAYSSCFFFDVILDTLGIFVTGVQMVLSLSYWYEAFKYGAVLIGTLIHLYVKTWIGERLIDHSSRLSDYVYNSSWQNVFTKDRLVLHLMILRSQKPCRINAGRLCVLSMESFKTVLKTSVSYFTALNSIR